MMILNINITSTPDKNEEEHIIKNLWDHNHRFTPVKITPLSIIVKKNDGKIIAGLIARTWWGALDIQYLWIHEDHRANGLGRQLMNTAEMEAIDRGCHMAYVDTFSFQALEFYKKLDYMEYGHLHSFAEQHTRYYLSKQFVDNFI